MPIAIGVEGRLIDRNIDVMPRCRFSPLFAAKFVGPVRDDRFADLGIEQLVDLILRRGCQSFFGDDADDLVALAAPRPSPRSGIASRTAGQQNAVSQASGYPTIPFPLNP